MSQQRMDILVEEDQYEWVRATAFNRHFTMSAIIRLALTDYIKKVEAENKKG